MSIGEGIAPTEDINDLRRWLEEFVIEANASIADLTAIKWDDLRFPATAINPTGQASDPDLEASNGLLLFAPTGIELIYAFMQLPHGWLEGSDIVPHVHWQKTTSASGDVVWRMRYKTALINEVMDADWSTPVDISQTVPGTPDTDTADKHMISSFGDDIDMSAFVVSDCILFEISRVGNDPSDTYGSDARLLEFDVHYQIDSKGSTFPFVKQKILK